MAVLEGIYQSVLDGDMNGATAGVNAALEEGVEAGEILNQGLIAAMTEVDQRSIFMFLNSLPPVERDVGPPVREIGSWEPKG